jgi:hypothetical protein
MSIANGQTVLKIGETVLTRFPLHHQSTSIKHNYQIGIWKRAHIAKPVYPEPTHDNGWQCVDGMIEPKWVSGDFIPQKFADALVEENIAGLTLPMSEKMKNE